ncbi:MAG: bacillithiol biosynthesis cysteine-adding enzyme BshC [Bacteroidetes bacterium]|nr:bacillithiol biosynthesis cysteine-adding enzyme BshC [Bacteroidota bacterium]
MPNTTKHRIFVTALARLAQVIPVIMEKQLLTYKSTRQFSDLVLDYLEGSDQLRPFFNRAPDLEQVKAQIQEKSQSFPPSSRAKLVQALIGQYQDFSLNESFDQRIKLAIQALSGEKTFTVTTGHQLNLFTGPLYFLYKIFGAINLAEQYTAQNPGYRFLPVFWMASEDHDFEEIAHFRTGAHKINWPKQGAGPVGRLMCTDLDEVLNTLDKLWGGTVIGRSMLNLFKSVYTPELTLAQATRKLVHELFKDYDLIIIDGDDAVLKSEFTSIMRHELTENGCSQAIEKTTQALTLKGYHKQVHPREINLFYCDSGLRERIIATESGFAIDQTEMRFTQGELLDLLERRPELFSPNALLRPLYQERVLPNLAYIGGGAEVAYWAQLKDCFATNALTYPMVYLRNSISLIPAKVISKLRRINLEISDLFLPMDELSRRYVARNSGLEIDFSAQITHLKKQFEQLYLMAKQTDASFMGAVGAQEKKQIKGLERLQQRLMRAEKRKHAQDIQRLAKMREWLFPEGTLQERKENMSWGLTQMGPEFLALLKNHIDPSDHRFTLLIYNS